MASTEPDIILLWADVIAGTALMAYIYLTWARMRGWIDPSSRLLFSFRILCVAGFMAPIAARFQFSESVILYLSLVVIFCGFIIRIRGKYGI